MLMDRSKSLVFLYSSDQFPQCLLTSAARYFQSAVRVHLCPTGSRGSNVLSTNLSDLCSSDDVEVVFDIAQRYLVHIKVGDVHPVVTDLGGVQREVIHSKPKHHYHHHHHHN